MHAMCRRPCRACQCARAPRLGCLFRRVSHWLGQVAASPATRAGWALVLGLVMGVGVQAAALPWAATAAVCVASMVVVVLALRHGVEVRRRRQVESWPEAVDLLGAALSQGVGLPEALSGLAEAGPPALRPAFRAFALSYTLSGILDEALDRLDGELDDWVGEHLMALVRLAQETGTAGLATALHELSATLRVERASRRLMVSSLAWGAHGSCLLAFVPWLVIGALHCSVVHLTPHASSTRQLLAGACLSGAAGILACVAGGLPQGARRP